MTSTSKAIAPRWPLVTPPVIHQNAIGQDHPAPAQLTDQNSVIHADLTSEELMDRVGVGDGQAFAELTRRHYPRSYAVAWRVLRDTGLAQDCVQEAFLRVWCKSHLWQRRNGGSFAAWLMRITTNLAIDEQRRPAHLERFHQSAPPILSDSSSELNLLEEYADFRPNPEQNAASQEIQHHIQKALASLPPRQCQAFILCQIDGQSNVEAAHIMGISVGALELLLVRARRSLRQNLADLYQLEHTT